jgi:hypothetical protein
MASREAWDNPRDCDVSIKQQTHGGMKNFSAFFETSRSFPSNNPRLKRAVTSIYKLLVLSILKQYDPHVASLLLGRFGKGDRSLCSFLNGARTIVNTTDSREHRSVVGLHDCKA